MPSLHDLVVICVGVAATAVLLWTFRDDPLLGVTAGVVTAVSTPLAIVDFREHRLPNRYVVPLAGFTTVAVGVLALVENDLGRGLGAIAIALAVFTALFLLGLLGGIGMGDVKFSYPLTAVLAWLGTASLQTALVVSILAAAIYTLIQAARTRTLKVMIPFGPFMGIGFVAGALVAAWP